MIQAWIYPGNPACNAQKEYQTRNIDVLKPEYLTVSSTGTIRRVTVASAGCNGFSLANALDVKAHSTEQYVTISSGAVNMASLCSTFYKRTAGINAIVKLLNEIKFTGVELDFEGFGQWNLTSYTNYKKFVNELQARLRTLGFKLMIDCPPISNAQEQGYYKFKYEDFKNVDYICVMAYDYQYDYGAGSSVAPIAWVGKIIDWVKARIPLDKIIIGVPSYGYHATTQMNGDVGYDVVIDTREQSLQVIAILASKRNQDGEWVFTSDDKTYVHQDTIGLNMKKKAIEAKNIKHISVWHLGGNNWF
jgi:spore germination protein YaaH